MFCVAGEEKLVEDVALAVFDGDKLSQRAVYCAQSAKLKVFLRGERPDYMIAFDA